MRLCFLLPGLLAASFSAYAQAGLSSGANASYHVQHDTLQARAARVRTQTAAGTTSFRSSYAGLLGTRRVITSLGNPFRQPAPDAVAREVMVKRETVKHKTRGAEVKKITYYAAGGRPRLYEYYEGGRLVRQELYDYPLPNGSGDYSFVTMRWVLGDYLLVQQRGRTAAGGSTLQEQAFTNVVAP